MFVNVNDLASENKFLFMCFELPAANFLKRCYGQPSFLNCHHMKLSI